MKTAFVIILSLLAEFTFAQRVIKLTHEEGPKHDYIFVDPKDSAFLYLWREEDMGQWENPNYNLKMNNANGDFAVPDGKYQVYVNEKLDMEAYVKDHKPDSVWTHHGNGRYWYVTTFSKGKPASEIYYYDNGQIFSTSYYTNGQWMSGAQYYKSGRIMSKGHREGDKSVFVEFKDSVNTGRAIDSVKKIIATAIANNKELKKLNSKQNLEVEILNYDYMNPVASSITYLVGKNKFKKYEFGPTGNIARIITTQDNYDRKFFYKKCGWNWENDHHYCHTYFTKVVKTSIHVDTIQIFYTDGKKCKELCDFRPGYPNFAFRMINAWDSTGKQTLQNGTGYFTEYQTGESRMVKRYKDYLLDDTTRYYSQKKLSTGKSVSNSSSFTVYKEGKTIYEYNDQYDWGKRIMAYDPKDDIVTITFYHTNRKDPEEAPRKIKYADCRFGPDYVLIYFR